MIIDRRKFLAGTAGAASLALFADSSTAFAAQVGKIGLQLYTVREIFAADPVGTLQKVAKVGYREVEFGGGNYEAMDHAMLRRTMDGLSLTCPSLHVPYPSLLEKFDASVKMVKTLGAQTVVMPWLSEDLRTEAAWEQVLPNLKRLSAQLKSEGLGFAYHNHDFEFLNRSRGVSLYERLIRETDAGELKFELDLYWAAHAGEDLKALIGRLGPRLYAFHVKDMKANKSMAAVGTGTIDFASLFRLPAAAGVHHFYVENDQAPAPYIPDIATSFKNLRALRF
jgi:sugar phosphate isomerase/epimerase